MSRLESIRRKYAALIQLNPITCDALTRSSHPTCCTFIVHAIVRYFAYLCAARCATLESRTFPTSFPSLSSISLAAAPSASIASLRPRLIASYSSSHPYSTSTLGTQSLGDSYAIPQTPHHRATHSHVRQHCNTLHTIRIVHTQRNALPQMYSNCPASGGSTISLSATSPATSSRRNGGPCISCGDCTSSTHTTHSWQRPRTCPADRHYFSVYVPLCVDRLCILYSQGPLAPLPHYSSSSIAGATTRSCRSGSGSLYSSAFP